LVIGPRTLAPFGRLALTLEEVQEIVTNDTIFRIPGDR
jgi:hypothetical protein